MALSSRPKWRDLRLHFGSLRFPKRVPTQSGPALQPPLPLNRRPLRLPLLHRSHIPPRLPIHIRHRQRPEGNQVHPRNQLAQERRRKLPVPPQQVDHRRPHAYIQCIIRRRFQTGKKYWKYHHLHQVRRNRQPQRGPEPQSLRERKRLRRHISLNPGQFPPNAQILRPRPSPPRPHSPDPIPQTPYPTPIH